jgi:hypothetical protein
MTADTGRLNRLVHPATTFLVPMVGIIELGWQLGVVLVIYWLEVGTTAVRLSIETTFAGLPNNETTKLHMPAFAKLREKRGGIPTPGPLPRIHPHGLPAAFHAGSLALVLWVFAGAGVVAIAGLDHLVAQRFDILAGAAGVVVGELVALFLRLRRRTYAELSPGVVFTLRDLLGPCAFLFLILLFTFQDGGPVDPQLPVVLVVYGQTIADTIREFGLFKRLLPEVAQPDTRVGERTPVPDGDGEPRARWRTDRRSLACARVVTSPGRTFGNRAGLLPLIIAAFLWFALDDTAGVVAAAGLLVTVAVIGAVPLVIERDLLHGHLEYRLYDDCLVAYDRLLETPQWRVGLDAVRETETSVALLDRLPGLELERLFVRTDDESQRLVGLADAEGVRERIDEARFE